MEFTIAVVVASITAIGIDATKEALKDMLKDGVMAVKRRLTKSERKKIDDQVERLVLEATYAETQKYSRPADAWAVRSAIRKIGGTKKEAPKRAVKKSMKKAMTKATKKAAKKATKKASKR